MITLRFGYYQPMNRRAVWQLLVGLAGAVVGIVNAADGPRVLVLGGTGQLGAMIVRDDSLAWPSPGR